MRFLCLFLLASAISHASDFPVFDSGKIRGSVILSPVDLRSFEITLAPAKTCTETDFGSYAHKKCILENVSGVFSEGNLVKNVIVFDRSLTLLFKKDSSAPTYQYVLVGRWTTTHNGNNLDIPLSVILNGETAKPGLFSGYLGMGEETKLFVRAHLEK